MKAKEIMTTEVIKVYQNETVLNCAKLMNKYNIGFLPIINEQDNLVGVITDRDIITKLISNDIDLNSNVSEIMTKKPITISKNDDISFAVSKMADNQIRRIIVLDKNIIKGIISLSDLTKSKDSLMYLPDLIKEISYNYDQDISLFKDINQSIEI